MVYKVFPKRETSTLEVPLSELDLVPVQSVWSAKAKRLIGEATDPTVGLDRDYELLPDDFWHRSQVNPTATPVDSVPFDPATFDDGSDIVDPAFEAAVLKIVESGDFDELVVRSVAQTDGIIDYYLIGSKADYHEKTHYYLLAQWSEGATMPALTSQSTADLWDALVTSIREYNLQCDMAQEMRAKRRAAITYNVLRLYIARFLMFWCLITGTRHGAEALGMSNWYALLLATCVAIVTAVFGAVVQERAYQRATDGKTQPNSFVSKALPMADYPKPARHLRHKHRVSLY